MCKDCKALEDFVIIYIIIVIQGTFILGNMFVNTVFLSILFIGLLVCFFKNEYWM